MLIFNYTGLASSPWNQSTDAEKKNVLSHHWIEITNIGCKAVVTEKDNAIWSHQLKERKMS